MDASSAEARAAADAGPGPAPAPGLVATLRAAGCVFAEDEAALLVAEARDDAELDRMLRRRVGGEPLEQVLGWAELAGVRVRVAPGVFVPRQRTAYLVELAVAHLQPRRRPLVVDLCCGTGAVGLAVRARVPGARLVAADLDSAAVACARLNVGDARVLEGDLYDALPVELAGRVDALVVNAPYVPTGEIGRMPPEAREHEHRVALDGGADGLDLHRRVAVGAPHWLAAGGMLLLETSTEQAEGSARACRDAGLRTVVRTREETGSTVTCAISDRPGSSGTMAR